MLKEPQYLQSIKIARIS